MGAEQYERRVEPATSALNSFADDLTQQLDMENGAFKWWEGHSDWKTLNMVADYLIQSVQGASTALLAASFAAKTHRESNYADSKALTDAWKAVQKTGSANPDAYFAAIPQDAAARRRALTITNSAEHCFFHLAQTLDRLSVAMIIIGGFTVKDVAAADWATIAGTPTRDGSSKTSPHQQLARRSNRQDQRAEHSKKTSSTPSPDQTTSGQRDGWTGCAIHATP